MIVSPLECEFHEWNDCICPHSHRVPRDYHRIWNIEGTQKFLLKTWQASPQQYLYSTYSKNLGFFSHVSLQKIDRRQNVKVHVSRSESTTN